MDSIMGKSYFKITGEGKNKEQLDKFFMDLGFRTVENKAYGEEVFKRAAIYTDDNGVTFTIIWYINIATVRIGDWGKPTIIDIDFDKIQGSYLPKSGYLTYDFVYGEDRTCTFAVKNTRGI